jgi:hypothetical protein
MTALSDQIRSELCGTATPLIEQLQTYPLLTFNPTPPSVDIYPAEVFQEGLAFGKGNNTIFLTVRARVAPADQEAGQELLLSMMDPQATTSLAQAVLSDRTLGAKVERVDVDGPTNYGIFVDPGAQGEALLGCTWRVRVTP